MNDRFKFRIWDSVDCEYIECDIIRLTPNGIFVCTEKNEPEINRKRFIVEFCIGLNDKNKKLIFENDIIERDDGKIFVIEWCQEKLGYVARNNNPNETLESLDISWQIFKIIGNVKENPELLERLKNETLDKN